RSWMGTGQRRRGNTGGIALRRPRIIVRWTRPTAIQSNLISANSVTRHAPLESLSLLARQTRLEVREWPVAAAAAEASRRQFESVLRERCQQGRRAEVSPGDRQRRRAGARERHVGDGGAPLGWAWEHVGKCAGDRAGSEIQCVAIRER